MKHQRTASARSKTIFHHETLTRYAGASIGGWMLKFACSLRMPAVLALQKDQLSVPITK